MLSKMASNSSGAGGGGSGGSGRRIPLSLSGGTTVSRLQQSSGSNGRSISPQNGNKKITESFKALKKPTQQRSSSTSSSSSSGSNQNGVNKPSNGKEKSQNGNSKDQKDQKSKDNVPEKKEQVDSENKEAVAEKMDTELEADQKVKDELDERNDKELVVETSDKDVAPSSDKMENQEAKKEATAEVTTTASQPALDTVDLEDVVEVIPELSTPSKDRRSTRKAGSQQKSPVSKLSPASPSQKKETEIDAVSLTPQEDADMEPLQMDASPIRTVIGNLNALPTATSTPGRNLFGFRSSSKQINDVGLAAQPSSSPAGTPARTFAQISGRRSIRAIDSLTPSKVGTYRCGNSDLDTSNCTNASMNATVGSEIPNSSSFSFSFFGRGRKRERTPPPLTASQSTSELGQDVEMSPPKRARFDLFSLNLASPFSLLRSRFSKTTISSPTRLCLEPNVSGVEEHQVHTCSNSLPEEVEGEEEQASKNVTVGQEAGLETPKKAGSPHKEIPAEKEVEGQDADGQDVDEKSSDGENIPPVVEVADVAGAEARSRCSIM
ncbi:suppressor protein SRP40 [Drosophila elegans]|uniref:suppressor protein SRP40 n=1 Tax=Drosophila elegans TaxID=30023 RepID=UPI001BC86886|nr:suppressor protein SRP40 [Drosophila elegans]